MVGQSSGFSNQIIIAIWISVVIIPREQKIQHSKDIGFFLGDQSVFPPSWWNNNTTGGVF